MGFSLINIQFFLLITKESYQGGSKIQDIIVETIRTNIVVISKKVFESVIIKNSKGFVKQIRKYFVIKNKSNSNKILVTKGTGKAFWRRFLNIIKYCEKIIIRRENLLRKEVVIKKNKKNQDYRDVSLKGGVSYYNPNI